MKNQMVALKRKVKRSTLEVTNREGQLRPYTPFNATLHTCQYFLSICFSGQQVLGPPRKKKNPEGIIKDVFKSAKE